MVTSMPLDRFSLLTLQACTLRLSFPSPRDGGIRAEFHLQVRSEVCLSSGLAIAMMSKVGKVQLRKDHESSKTRTPGFDVASH